MGYEKGEEVFSDQPFAYVVKPKFQKTVCDNCLKESPSMYFHINMWSRRSAIERCRSSATAQLCLKSVLDHYTLSSMFLKKRALVNH